MEQGDLTIQVEISQRGGGPSCPTMAMQSRDDVTFQPGERKLTLALVEVECGWGLGRDRSRETISEAVALVRREVRRAQAAWQEDRRWMSERGPDETDLTWYCPQRGPSTVPRSVHTKHLCLPCFSQEGACFVPGLSGLLRKGLPIPLSTNPRRIISCF